MTHFAISIPQHFGDGAFDPGPFRAYLSRAEELGFESGWTQEQVLGPAPQLSPIETMSYAAACTEHLRLGCAVLVTTLHSPVHLAKSISALDQLSRGRVELGVASGGQRQFSAFGVDPDTFVARFNEGLELMKACWTEPSITFKGRFWQLENDAMEPKPFQKPHPPIWFGARSPAALRRAVRHGNGFFGAGSATTAEFADQAKLVRDFLTEQRRDPTGFPIAKRVYIAIDDDAARAQQRISDALDELYYFAPKGAMAPVAVAGTPEACVAGVRDVAAAGAELILLNPMFDAAEQMERLAAEVVPQLA